VRGVRARAAVRVPHSPGRPGAARAEPAGALTRHLRTAAYQLTSLVAFTGVALSCTTTPGPGAGGNANLTCDFDLSHACSACIARKCKQFADSCACDPNCKPCVQRTWQSTSCSDDAPLPSNAVDLLRCIENGCLAECPAADVPQLTDDQGMIAPDCNATPTVSSMPGWCVTVGDSNDVACNPVLVNSCTSGVCDFSPSDLHFACRPLDAIKGVTNARLACQKCGYFRDWCGAGLHCVGVCVRYCCGPEDCGGHECDTAYVANLFLNNLPSGVSGFLGVCK